MKCAISLITLCALSTAFAVNETPPHSQSLNQQMTVKEQKETGVSKLSKKERQNLETWLQNKLLQTRPQKDKLEDQTVSSSTLSINIDGGAFLQLYDGSVWEIAPTDREVTQNWISPIGITIEIVPGNAWPFKLLNQSNQESVYARRSNLNYASSLPTIQSKPTKDVNKQKKETKNSPSSRSS